MARLPRQQRTRTLINDPKIKHVTFSKRRNSVFQKASELCTLSGTEMALIVISPGDKLYSFGHPSTEAVLNRLIIGYSFSPPPSERAQKEATMEELNKQLDDLNIGLTEERKKGFELNKKVTNLPDVEKMDRNELMNMKESLEDLRVQLKKRKEERPSAKMNGENDDNDDDSLRLTLGAVYAVANDAY